MKLQPNKGQERQSAALAALRADMALLKARQQANRAANKRAAATMGWPVLVGGAK